MGIAPSQLRPMTGYTTHGWGELFLAEAGASAALGGLLFVAVSINLERIISIRSLPGAALATIVLLVAVLMVSTFALVPEQPRWVLGSEVLVVGIVAWSTVTGISLRALRAPIPNQPRFVPLISVVATQAATLLHAGGDPVAGADGQNPAQPRGERVRVLQLLGQGSVQADAAWHLGR
jgi:hypothetical protein